MGLRGSQTRGGASIMGGGPGLVETMTMRDLEMSKVPSVK